MANDTIRYTLDADTSRFQRAMKDAAKTTSDFEQKVKDLASDLSGHTAQRGMSQLQAAVKQLGGLSGVSSKQIQNLKQQVLSLGAAGAKIPREFAALNKELTNFQKLAKGFGEGIKQGVGVGAGFALATSAASALVSAVKAVPSAIIDAVASLAKMADHLDTLSLTTGLSTTALQELRFAAERGGTTVEAMSQAIGVMQRNITSGNPVYFEKLNISLHTLQAMSPENQFKAVAAAIKGITDPSRQAAVAMEALGRSGLALLPAIKAGISETAQDAHRFGAVMSGETLKAAKQLGDQFKNVSMATEHLKNQFAAAIAEQPALQEGLRGVADAIGLVAVAVKDAAPSLRLYVELLSKLSGVTSVLEGASLAQLFASGPSVKTPHSFGSEAPPGIDFGSIDARALSAFDRNVKADKKAATEREAANKKLAAAYREYFKTLREIANAFEEQRTIDIIGTPGGLGVGFSAMPGIVSETKAKRDLDAARAAGITVGEDKWAIVNARQALLDAGNTFEKGSMARLGASKDADALGLDWGKQFKEGFAGAMKDLPGVIVGAIQGGGSVIGAIGAHIGGQFGQSLSGPVTKALSGVFGKTLGGALGAMLPGVGSLLGGAVGGIANKLVFGGQQEHMRVNDMRDEFLKGFDTSTFKTLEDGTSALAKKAAEAGVNLDRLFAAKTVKDYEAAVEHLTEALKAEEERVRIQAAAKQARSQAIDQLGGAAAEFFKGRTITTEEEAQRQGVLFSAAWGQVVKERGIVAASDAFKDAFAKMKADIEAAGIDMPAWMQAISGQMGLGQNEAFRGAAQGAQTAAGFLGALGGSGGLTPEAFRAFEQEARAQFNAASGAATEAGMETAEATKAGFSATNPLLKELLNQSMVSGQALSDDIQAMIDQAGVTADVDVQQLDELRQIRAAVQVMAGQGGAPTVIGPAAGDFDRGDFGGEDRIPGFASGGSVTRTGLALVHQGERIFSRDDVRAGGTVNIGPITVQASGNRATDELMVQKLTVELGRLVRKGRATHLTSALFDDGFSRKGRL